MPLSVVVPMTSVESVPLRAASPLDISLSDHRRRLIFHQLTQFEGRLEPVWRILLAEASEATMQEVERLLLEQPRW